MEDTKVPGTQGTTQAHPVCEVSFQTSGRSFYVVGSIGDWLRENRARERKAGGFLIGGGVAHLPPVDLGRLRRLARIFPEGAAAKALSQATGRWVRTSRSLPPEA